MADLTYDSLVEDGSYISDRARLENKVILDELERKKKARSLAVPTDDNRVKARLREIGEPITLFGERVRWVLWVPEEDSEKYRLQTGETVWSTSCPKLLLLAAMMLCKSKKNQRARKKRYLLDTHLDRSLILDAQEEEFYSPGSLELLEARRWIAEYSLPRLDLRYQ
jgi:U4/U6 small nuclear ribonucleoprotein PRP4